MSRMMMQLLKCKALVISLAALVSLSECKSTQFQVRNAITNPARLWPNGRVPYTFASDLDAYRKVHVLSAMKQVMLSVYSSGNPCILFVPRKTETDYVEIRFAGLQHVGGNIGRAGGKQVIMIQPTVTQNVIVQSLMFALGINPEVARPDRDNFLTIVTSNIDPTARTSFQIEPDTDSFRQPFDYDTVVMYIPYLGAIDKSMPTIKANFDGFVFGQTVSLSSGDVNLVQHVYQCTQDASHRVDILGPLTMECHFHFDFCSLSQDSSDTFDWVLHQGPTMTPGTGPNADFSSGSGSYALAVASNHHAGVARLNTPTFPAGQYCFVVFIYLYGNDVGQLRVIQSDVTGEKPIVGVLKTPENHWYHGSWTIRAPSSFKLKIEAHMGNGDQGDIAIDDVYIYRGQCIDWW